MYKHPLEAGKTLKINRIHITSLQYSFVYVNATYMHTNTCYPPWPAFKGLYLASSVPLASLRKKLSIST